MDYFDVLILTAKRKNTEFGLAVSVVFGIDMAEEITEPVSIPNAF